MSGETLSWIRALKQTVIIGTVTVILSVVKNLDKAFGSKIISWAILQQNNTTASTYFLQDIVFYNFIFHITFSHRKQLRFVIHWILLKTRPSTIRVRPLSRRVSFAFWRHFFACFLPWRYGFNCRHSAKFVENSWFEA